MIDDFLFQMDDVTISLKLIVCVESQKERLEDEIPYLFSLIQHVYIYKRVSLHNR